MARNLAAKGIWVSVSVAQDHLVHWRLWLVAHFITFAVKGPDILFGRHFTFGATFLEADL
jgi:hypothetical protein